MSVEKFSVSFDPKLGQALRAAALAEGTNISSWLAEAIRQKLRHAALGSALDEILAEEGWTREELLNEVSVRSRSKRAA